MATITPQSVSSAGTAVTMTAATAGGDTIANASGARFIVTNGSASAITVTFNGVVACSQGYTHNVTVSVAAGATEQVLVPTQCVNASNGNASVSYSAATSVTVGATV